MRRLKAFGFAAAIAAAATLTGCVSKTDIAVQQPARVPEAAAVRRIAVLPFTGPGGPEATLKFESMLSQVKEGGRPFFTIVDRGALESAMAQLKLQPARPIEERSLARLGALLGVHGIYSGSVEVLPTIETSEVRRSLECSDYRCSSLKEGQVTCKERLVQYTLSPKLTEMSTNRVIYQRSYAKAETASFCRESLPDAPEVLLGRALDKAFQEVRMDVAPYVETRSIVLKDSADELSGPAKTRFSDALKFAESGRMDRACDLWSAMSTEGIASLDLSYNLAVCDESDGRLDEAQARYQAIDKSLQRPDSHLNDALVRVRDRMSERRQLEEQQRLVEPPKFAPAAGADVHQGDGKARSSKKKTR